MPACLAPGCTIGYKSNCEKVHCFTVPNNVELRTKWQEALRRPQTLVKKQVVCEKHFLKEDVIRERQILGPDGQVLGVSPLAKPKLRDGAIPFWFPWTEVPNGQSVSTPSTLPPEVPNGQSVSTPSTLSPIKRHNTLNTSLNSNKSEECSFNIGETSILSDLNDSLLATSEFSELSASSKLNDTISEETVPFTFEDVLHGMMSLPLSWTRNNVTVEGESLASFSKIVTVKQQDDQRLYCSIIQKEITVNSKLEVRVFAFGQVVNNLNCGITNTISSLKTLEETIRTINSLSVCNGCLLPESIKTKNGDLTIKDWRGTLRHKDCELLTHSASCKFCHLAKRKLVRQEQRKNAQSAHKERSDIHRHPKKYIQNLRKSVKRKQNRIARLVLENRKLKNELDEAHKKMTRLQNEKVLKHLENLNIPKNQRDLVEAILNTAKCKTPQGPRYKEDWMLLCMLLHMRSASGYTFLRENNILPLPGISTIRRCLSTLDTQCGFDPRFFEIMKKFLDEKEESERHGLLLIDEMSTRESAGVKSKTLTYAGLVDFGEEHKSAETLDDIANYALVIVFRSIDGSYTQPIAVFASHGPTPGLVLAKLIVKAIVMLEKIGAVVHGVVTDGASTNRKFWSEMGVNGTKEKLKNYFPHPVAADRKVYVFSDTPHLMKTIRNRLHNNGWLQINPAQSPIKWEHFQSVYDEESKLPGKLRTCPKITRSHLNPNSCQKMRVNLAVQMLSKSMADSLSFYKQTVPALKDSEGTEEFCRWMNSLFDALNRTSGKVGRETNTVNSTGRAEKRKSTHGVIPGDTDFKILESSLQRLNIWEGFVESGLLPQEAFLTRQTAEGLRVTLQSTLDLVKDLTTVHRFKEVFTGNINQDPLEQFFGTVRAAGGSNDHPATPTFLQIYKILSLFSILKPPRTGNCTITIDHEPLIKLSELKLIYAKKDESAAINKLNEIKQRLINAVKTKNSIAEDYLVDHDYSAPPPVEVVDCLLYYVTESICNKLVNANDCKECLDAIQGSNPEASDPRTTFLQLKHFNNFIHPNEKLFKLVCALEKLFQQHCKSVNVYEKVIDGIIESPTLTFPCDLHGPELLSAVVHYYIRMRMFHFTSKLNQEKVKSNQTKKKAAKFCTT